MNRTVPASREPRVFARDASRFVAVLALAAGLLACAAPACLAADAPPDGATILARYAAAMGGAAWDSLQNMVLHKVLSLQGTNVQVGVTEYRARPNRMYVIQDSPAGKGYVGVTGEDAWEYSVQQGSKLLEGQEQADALREAHFDGLVKWKKGYRLADAAGVDTVGNRPCYKVVMKPRMGSPETMWFDEETGLLARVEGTYESTQLGTTTARTEYSDYRKIGNVMLPHKSITDMRGQRIVITMVEVELNKELDADRFDPPSEVRKLISAKKP
ncbi:MAG: DUF4292 domain-containing protein [Candidatus Eisenbacteria bacterium]|nr:DUF4292 domain-containing protein [Candidatus Eisenbacteria bacterium]